MMPTTNTMGMAPGKLAQRCRQVKPPMRCPSAGFHTHMPTMSAV